MIPDAKQSTPIIPVNVSLVRFKIRAASLFRNTVNAQTEVAAAAAAAAAVAAAVAAATAGVTAIVFRSSG